MTAPHFSRRAALAGGVALSVLPACARDERPPLGLYNWDSYVAPATLAAFEAVSGSAVVQSTFASDNELVARLAGGSTEFDVVVPSHLGLARLREAGLVRPLDARRLPNLRNLDPFWRDPAYDPRCSHSVPYSWQVTGVAVRPGTPLPGRWAEVFAPGGSARLAVPALSTGIVALALRAGSASGDATARIDAAAALLIGCAHRIVIAAGEPADVLVAGGADIALTDGAVASKTRLPVAVPAEGGLLAADTLAIPVRAQRPAAAHALIDHLLRADAGAALAALTGYPTPNAAAREAMPVSYRASPTLFPSNEKLRRCAFETPPNPDAATAIDAALRRIRAAIDR